MALRELLAVFDIQVSGAEQLEQAHGQLDAASQAAAETGASIDQLASTDVGGVGQVGDEASSAAAGIDEMGSAAAQATRQTQELANTADKSGTELSGLQKIVGNLSGELLALGAAVASAFGISAISSFISETLRAADAIGKLATRTGLTTDAVQVYQEFARRAGAEASSLDEVVKSLAERMLTAQRGSKELAESFKALGVEVQNSDGSLRDINAVLPEVLAGLADTRSEAERLALANATLGGSSAALTAGLGENSEALREQLEMLERTATVLSEDFIREAEATNDEISLMARQIDGVKAALVAELLPAIRWVVDRFTEWGLALRSALQDTNLLRNGLIALFGGGVLKGLSVLVARLGGFRGILMKLRPLLATLAKFALRFLLPFFILDDIITWLEGGESALGDLLDWFGPGTSEAVREVFQEIISVIGSVVDAAVALFKAIFTGSDEAWAEFLSASEPIVEFIDGLIETFSEFFEFLWRDFKQLVSDWSNALSGFTEFLPEAWQGAVDAVIKVLASLGEFIVSLFSGSWDNVKASFFGVWDAIKAAVSEFLTDIPGKFAAIANLIPGVNIETPKLGGAAQASATAAGAAEANRSTTLNDNRTVQINAQGATPGVVSGVERAVNQSNLQDRNAAMRALARD